MKIYTKTGDRGLTSLIGGQRVKKDHDRLNAYGNLDELNSVLGVVRSQLTETMKGEIDSLLVQIQNQLFNLGSHLACDNPKARQKLPSLSRHEVQTLEEAIDKHTSQLPPLQEFILPGGHPSAAQMHVARTLCRRAERKSVKIKDETTEALIIPYLNRLSDLLFVLARRCNQIAGQRDVTWKK